jgi:predicted oxidoreductase
MRAASQYCSEFVVRATAGAKAAAWASGLPAGLLEVRLVETPPTKTHSQLYRGQDKGVKPGQLALAWVLAQGDDMVPIPGTKRRAYLEENVAAVDVSLNQSELEQISRAVPKGMAAGERYPERAMAAVNR